MQRDVLPTTHLLRFAASSFDDPRSSFTLAQEEVSELWLRHAHRIGPVFCEPVAHIRRGHYLRDVFRQLIHYSDRSSRRYPHSVPDREVETRHAGLGDRRNLG